MASEQVTGGSERGGEEMNGNGSSKVVIGGGVGGAYRWKNGGGDAVQLKRRRVGLSNGGGSASDDEEGNSSSEEEEEQEQPLDEDEDVEEGAAEEYSDDYEEGGRGRAAGGPSATIEEEDEEEEEEEEEVEEEAKEEEDEEQEDEERHHVGAGASMDRHRGGISSGSRGREPVGFVEEHDEDYDEEELAVPDSPPVARSRGREREIQMSSPDEVGRRDASDDSEDERGRVPQQPISRGMIERGQSSSIARESEAHHHREMMTVVLPEKPAKGMMNTAKRKAPVVSGVISRNGSGGQPKPKKEKAPAAPRKKGNREGTTGARERQRFSTDNKARVTLERAREILEAVKAAMMKDPKQFTVSHAENHAAVENSSSSEEERRIRMTQTAPASQRVVHHTHQVQSEEKVVKKRSRATPKGGDTKEPTPRRRKPKVEVDYAADEKEFYRSRPQQVEGHDHTFKLGHFSTSAAEDREVDDRNSYGRDDGFEQQQQQHVTVVEKKVRKRRKVKEGEDLASATGLCPGSVIRDENWAPPASPYGLIQESLYKDPWKVLLSCMLLNKTAGRQMHKVIWDLFSLCPDAETAINMDTAKIAEKVYSLGLQNKRAKMIQRFSLEYLRGDWTNVTQLHGIGKYAADAYAIFCQGLWREVEPDDLMLNKYWKFLWDTDGRGTAFNASEQP